MNSLIMAQNDDFLLSLAESRILLDKTVQCLEKAKHAHMQVEALYVPNMNFTEINRCWRRRSASWKETNKNTAKLLQSRFTAQKGAIQH